MQEPLVHADQPVKQSLLLAARELDLVAKTLREVRTGFNERPTSLWPGTEEMRLQLARAADVALRLLEEKRLSPPQKKQPWLQFATEGSAEWKLVCFVAPSSDGGLDQPAGTFELFLELAMVMQEGRSHGDNIAVWNDAEANFVRRHLFLEAVATWLPDCIGLNRPRFVLPHWYICLQSELGVPSFELISDWFDRDGLRGSISSVQVVTSECARMCEAFAAWARAQLGDDREIGKAVDIEGTAPVEQSEERTAHDTSRSLSRRHVRALALYDAARQADPNVDSIERAYEWLSEREQYRESMCLRDRKTRMSLDTFRNYVSGALLKSGRKEPLRRTAQRIRH